MPKVSSAPADAQKSEQVVIHRLLLAPQRIVRTKSNRNARPGPPPPDEERAIEGLARELREVGQIIPLVVGPPDERGFYPLIDGGRRLSAAQLIESEDGTPFLLWCVEGSAATPAEAQRHAIHANLKRRGLTPLQLAHLIANLRKEHNWQGTKEVAAYLNVSRAQISEHDKLLKRPDGMDKATYEKLLSLVQEGRVGAGTAFYTLTHVEPAKASEVLERAEALAETDESKKSATSSRKAAPDAPRSANARESASEKEAEPPKHDWAEITCSKSLFKELSDSYSGDLIPQGKIRKPVQQDADTTPYVCVAFHGDSATCYEVYPVAEFDGEPTTYRTRANHGDPSRSDPKGFYHGVQVTFGRRNLVLYGPPVVYVPDRTVAEPAKPASKPKVEKKHVQKAARESGAVRTSVQRTLPELRMLFAKLAAVEFPDRLRNFASMVADTWWNGRATDREVLDKWKELSAHLREDTSPHISAHKTDAAMRARGRRIRTAAKKRVKRAA